MNREELVAIIKKAIELGGTLEGCAFIYRSRGDELKVFYRHPPSSLDSAVDISNIDSFRLEVTPLLEYNRRYLLRLGEIILSSNTPLKWLDEYMAELYEVDLRIANDKELSALILETLKGGGK